MTDHNVNVEKQIGTSDVTYNRISILYHALQGGENYAVYAKDAEETGERDFAQFFQELVDQERARAERVKQLLKERL